MSEEEFFCWWYGLGEGEDADSETEDEYENKCALCFDEKKVEEMERPMDQQPKEERNEGITTRVFLTVSNSTSIAYFFNAQSLNIW
ncbi:hypothetical protein MUP42_02535 [Candidatus Bathyarchaeota archaeon]|nr:hypothetical protein [Candidatus Bathyarchaeota archaeon]